MINLPQRKNVTLFINLDLYLYLVQPAKAKVKVNVTLLINLDLVQPATPALKLRKAIICFKEEEEGVKRYTVALVERGSFGQNQNWNRSLELLHQLIYVAPGQVWGCRGAWGGLISSAQHRPELKSSTSEKHWSARPPRHWECPQTGTWGVWGRWRWLTAVLGCWWRCAPPHYSTAPVPRYHIDAFEGHADSHLPPVKVDGFELCVSPVTLGSFFGRGQRLVGKMWWPKTWVGKINFLVKKHEAHVMQSGPEQS